jgi:hypothetical protein
MANFTETDQFPANIYRLDITDPALGGGPNNKANIQARDLTDRTRYLYNRVNKIFFSYLTAGPLVVPAGIVGNVNGNSYVPNVFPLNFPDYTTPNDGVTRLWEITVSFECAWTETAGQYIGIRLYTVTNVPAYLELMRNIRKEGTIGSFTYKRIISFPPNYRVALAYQNAATGANATFENIQLTMKEL